MAVVLDAYVRVSQVAGRGGGSFLSPGLQLDQIERWSAQHGVALGHLFEELDESGGRSDRPLLQQAITRVEQGDSDGVVVAYLSRFGRSLLDALAAIDRITKAGGTFVSVQENLDFSTDAGRFVLRVLFSVADWERDRTRAGWAAARERAVGRGVWCCPRLFGYQRAKDGRLVPDPQEAPIVRELFARRAAGAQYVELCRWLEGKAVRTASGGRVWELTVVARMFSRRAYRGEIHSGTFENLTAHPPLVDEAIWQAAQPTQGAHLRSRRSDRHGRTPLLRGILRCAGCRRLMISGLHLLSKGQFEARGYRCRGRGRNNPCPAPAQVLESVVEPYVEALFWQELEATTRTPSAKRLRKLEEMVERREAELAAYRDNVSIAARIGQARFADGLSTRMRQLENASAQLSGARMRERPSPLPPPAQLRERWPSMRLDERRAAIAEVIEAAFLFRGRRNIGDRLFVCRRGEAPPNLPARYSHLGAEVTAFDPSTCPPSVCRRSQPAQLTTRQLRERLQPFMAGRSRWPTFREFQAAGLASLYEQVERHGGPAPVAELFGLSAYAGPDETVHGWSEPRVRRELGEYLAHKTVWPTRDEFIADGRERLRNAVNYFGGPDRWANEIGIVLPANQRQRRRSRRHCT